MISRLFNLVCSHDKPLVLQLRATSLCSDDSLRLGAEAVLELWHAHPPNSCSGNACQHAVTRKTQEGQRYAGVLQLMAWMLRALTLSLKTGGMLSTSMMNGDF